jgi:hypothetical protein
MVGRSSSSPPSPSTFRGLSRACLLTGCAAVVLLQARPSHAFKLQTHEAVALDAANQIANHFAADAGGNLVSPADGKLVFNIDGKKLEVPIAVRDVINAVQHQPTYFLGGMMGPDAFPDPITGQWIAHENGTDSLGSLVQDAAGRTVKTPDIWTPFEQRHSVAQYRAIDFAMDMIKFYNDDYSHRPGPSPTEKEQILAFMAGYLSHGVTDGFAHTWVNDIVGHSWAFLKGGGMFGTLTEEVQHTAVESLVDHRAPKTAFQTPGDGGGFGKLQMDSPTNFLDAYYSSPTALGGDIHFNIANDPVSFINYYRNLDLFRGGIIETYFNVQKDLMPALRSWSRMGFLFDLAEDVNNNTVVQVLLSLIDIPIDILNDIVYGATVGVTQGINDATSLATFGYLQCLPENTIRVFAQNISFTDGLRQGLQWLGGMNQRINAHVERATVARRNWTRLSECVGESFAKAEAAPFDKNNPGVNTDPCADIVRAGYKDENPQQLGLDRGNVKPTTISIFGQTITIMDPLNAEFLMDLKGSFLGSNPDTIYNPNDPNRWKGDAPYDHSQAYEDNNDHRKVGRNFERLLTYIRFPGFTLADFADVILPPSAPSGPSPLAEFEAVCADARNNKFENCIDVATLPIASAAREAVCLKDLATCTAGEVSKCAKELCQVSCNSGIGFSCDDLCGHATGCQGWCNDNLCTTFGTPLGDVTLCVPIVYQACSGICQIVGGPDSSCLQDGVGVAICGTKEIRCSLDDIKKTLLLEGLGSAILGPVRKVCDMVDDVRNFFACVKGDPNATDAVNMANRHVCVVNACNKVIAEGGSSLPAELRNFDCEKAWTKFENAWDEVMSVKDAWSNLMQAALANPEAFVNVVFFQKDAANDAAYKQTILQAASDKRAALIANPPPATATAADKQLYQDEITVLDAIVAAANGNPTPMGLQAIRLGPALDALSKQPWPAVQGPTVRQIISDMGADFNNSFNPVFNAVQGTKLTPVMAASDISTFFSTTGQSTALLPSHFQVGQDPFYSNICHTTPHTSVYCDVLSSFDDPNCKGPECPTGNTADGETVDYTKPLDPNGLAGARNGWIPGRGIVAFNKFDPTKTVQNVVTDFPLAATQPIYDNLYKRVFQVPRVVPGFFGFEDPNHPWTSPQATITPNTGRSTQGTASVDVKGCGFADINSPIFMTTDIGVVGTTLQIDVNLPAPSNPSWAGDMQMSIQIPGANIYSVYLNNGNPVPFTGLSPGWHTLTYSIPANVVTALLGNFGNAQISLHVNLATCNAPIGLDNLRFGGTLTPRTVFHIRPSDAYGVDTGKVMGFDNVGDWSGSTAISAAPTFIQGTGAIAVPAGGYNPIVSRSFTPAEDGVPSSAMSIDVYIPGPQTNRYWFGDVQLFWECQHFPKISLGDKPLTNGFENEYNSLKFDVPANMVNFLKTAAPTETCKVTVALNTNSGGTFFLDNLGFIK